MFAVLPAEIVDYIVSFMDIKDRNRFAMTRKEYYNIYKVQMDLYKIIPQIPPVFIIRNLLELRIPQERIIVHPESYVLKYYPLCKTNRGLPMYGKFYVIMVWLTPLEEALAFMRSIVPIPIKPDAS